MITVYITFFLKNYTIEEPASIFETIPKISKNSK